MPHDNHRDDHGRRRRPAEQDVNAAIVGIYEASKVISAAPDLGRGLRDLVNLLPAFWGVSRVTITLRDHDEQVTVVAASHASQESIRRGKVPVQRNVVMPVLSHSMPLVVPDVRVDPLTRETLRESDLPEGLRVGLIALPIKAGGIPIGVLAAERAYQADDTINFSLDVQVLAVVANLVGQAVCAHSLRTAAPGEDAAMAASVTADTPTSPAVATVATAAAAVVERTARAARGKPPLYHVEHVIGNSQRMQEVFADLHQVAPTNTTVLLRGDSGTGKEMLARAVHYLSPRRDQPFVKVNCAALSETLLESELFGHERGAFTGAQGERKGRFEMAHGGTLFLDEIGDISPAFQTKLLRVLQEGEFERVGGGRTLKVDVRLVAATNRNLEEAVIAGTFRSDLYYRLNVVPIFLPPLRERREDIPLLVQHFIAQFNQENQRTLQLSENALRVLSEECPFPGNVRELENCVKRLCTMARGETIETMDFPCRRNQCATPFLARRTLVTASDHPTAGSALPPLPASIASPAANPTGIAPPTIDNPAIENDEGDEPEDGSFIDSPDMRQRLIEAMEKSGWVQAKAARMLGLTPRQIGYALRKHQVVLKKL